MNSESYSRVTTALEGLGSKSKDVRDRHSMWQCPAHPDNNPSLGVDDRGDKVVLRCYAGCHVDDIMAALGLTLADLFDGELEKDDTSRAVLVRSYLYENPNGEPWFYVDRYYPKTFRQRLPGVEPAPDLSARSKNPGLDERPPIPYHFPRVRRCIDAGDCTVWWVDGEKDVETAERHGLVATCPPGFAKWRKWYATRLEGAAEIVIVEDQDKSKQNGDLTPGQKQAKEAWAGFRAAGLKVRVVSPAVGKDLTDHFNAGHGVEDFRLSGTTATRPRGLTAHELGTKEFPKIRWCVPDLLPQGVTLFGGSPKVGKSWVSLNLACAVASGGFAMGSLRANQGSVIYLAREDNYRRLQSRVEYVMGGSLSDFPKGLELIPLEEDWPGGEEGLANLTQWAEEVGNPALVILDTLVKVEPEMGEQRNGSGIYTGNYRMMSQYKVWADRHNAAVLMVHHDKKTDAKTAKDADPFDLFSGSRALTGAADTLWFLRAVYQDGKRTDQGLLDITGRDVVQQQIDMKQRHGLWEVFSLIQKAD